MLSQQLARLLEKSFGHCGCDILAQFVFTGAAGPRRIGMKKIATFLIISISAASVIFAQTPAASVAGDWWRNNVTVTPRPANIAINVTAQGENLKVFNRFWKVAGDQPMPETVVVRQGATDTFKSATPIAFLRVSGYSQLTKAIPCFVIFEFKGPAEATLKLVKQQGGAVIDAKEVQNGREVFVKQEWKLVR